MSNRGVRFEDLRILGSLRLGGCLDALRELDCMERITHTWRSRVLVADGAMGTLLLSRAGGVSGCVELLNLKSPHLVEQAHREYLAAGAQIIETNTFAANRLKLAKAEMHTGVEEINRAAVRIARRVAAGRAYIGGSVGPLGAPLWPFGVTRADEAKDIFAEHISAIASEQPDFLILETFGSVAEMLLAIEAAQHIAPELPVLASLATVEDGKTVGGDPLVDAFARLFDAGAAAVGVNCAVGPHAVLDALAPLAGGICGPLSVMPNAGYPRRIDDRTIYESSPEYFAEFAGRFVELGATVVGGCCGTTPGHIRAIERTVRELSPRAAPPAQPLRVAGEARHARLLTSAPSPGAFDRKLGRSFVTTVELAPPRGPDAGDAIAAAKLLETAGADAVNVSDNPTARLRMASCALAHLIMRATKLATILHLGCRDRNVLGLQSDLLGAAALGVTAVLPLTGDPSNIGDFPKATSVFDVTALGLTEILAALNRGTDQAGNSIGMPTHFRIGMAVNPHAKLMHAELERMEQKRNAGADFAITQPIFDLAALRAYVEWAAQHNFPLIAGVVLLRDYANAEFLHNEVPGMQIPEPVRRRMRFARDQKAEGVAIARELIAQLAGTAGVAGAYLIPQDRYREAAEAIAGVGAPTQNRDVAAFGHDGSFTRDAGAP
jgi:methionine synthase I (cobalamin-dependent)/5,10-methylenetetrahydrofolate reductase